MLMKEWKKKNKNKNKIKKLLNIFNIKINLQFFYLSQKIKIF
jgi:hypothetical protein